LELYQNDKYPPTEKVDRYGSRVEREDIEKNCM
jgi:hypothetical protein